MGPALAEALVVLRKGGSEILFRPALLLGVAMLVARGALELFDLGEPGLMRSVWVFALPVLLLIAAVPLGWRLRIPPSSVSQGGADQLTRPNNNASRVKGNLSSLIMIDP